MSFNFFHANNTNSNSNSGDTSTHTTYSVLLGVNSPTTASNEFIAKMGGKTFKFSIDHKNQPHQVEVPEHLIDKEFPVYCEIVDPSSWNYISISGPSTFLTFDSNHVLILSSEPIPTNPKETNPKFAEKLKDRIENDLQFFEALKKAAAIFQKSDSFFRTLAIIQSRSFVQDYEKKQIEFIDSTIVHFGIYKTNHDKTIADTSASIKKSLETAVITIGSRIKSYALSLTSFTNPHPASKALLDSIKNVVTSDPEIHASAIYSKVVGWINEVNSDQSKFLTIFESELFSDLVGLFRFHCGNQQKSFLKFLEGMLSKPLPRDLLFSTAVTNWAKIFNQFLQAMMTASDLSKPREFFLKSMGAPKDKIEVSGIFKAIVIAKLNEKLLANAKFSEYFTKTEFGWSFNDLKYYNNFSVAVQSVFDEIAALILSGLKMLPERYDELFEQNFQEFEKILKSTFLSSEMLQNYNFAKNLPIFKENLLKDGEENCNEMIEMSKNSEISKYPAIVVIGDEKKRTNATIQKITNSTPSKKQIILDAGEIKNLEKIADIAKNFGIAPENVEKVVLAVNPKEAPELVFADNSYYNNLKHLILSKPSNAQFDIFPRDKIWEDAVNSLWKNDLKMEN